MLNHPKPVSIGEEPGVSFDLVSVSGSEVIRGPVTRVSGREDAVLTAPVRSGCDPFTASSGLQPGETELSKGRSRTVITGTV